MTSLLQKARNSNIIRIVYFLSFSVFMLFGNIRYCFLNHNVDSISALSNYLTIGMLGLGCALAALTTAVYLEKRDWIRLLFVVIPAIVFAFFSNEIALIFSAAVILCTKKITVRQILLIDFCSKLVTILLAVVLCVLGIVKDTGMVKELFLLVFHTHTYGFANPNRLGMICLLTAVDGICVLSMPMETNNRLFQWLKQNGKFLLLLFSICAFFVTCSKTLLVFCFLLIAYLLIEDTRFKLHFHPLFVPFLCVIPVILSYFYRSFGSFSETLNKIDQSFFSGRFFLGYGYFQTYEVGVFGQELDFNHLKFEYIPLTLDDFYVRAILNFGFLYFILFVIAAFLVAVYAKNEHSEWGRGLGFIVFVVLLCGITESSFYNAWFNPLFLVLPAIIYSDFSWKKIAQSFRIMPERKLKNDEKQSDEEHIA